MSDLNHEIDMMLLTISRLKRSHSESLIELESLHQSILNLRTRLSPAEKEKTSEIKEVVKPKAKTVVRRIDEESEKPMDVSQEKYNIQVVGLGTVKVDF
jgi:hypothetical protein